MSHYRTVDAAGLQALVASRPTGLFFILDVRPIEEYEAGHVPGSLHCPLHELSHRQKTLPPRSARLVVVAPPEKRADAAANFLALIGYADVALLDGGFAGWPGPAETGPPPAYDPRPPKPKGWVDPPKR